MQASQYTFEITLGGTTKLAPLAWYKEGRWMDSLLYVFVVEMEILIVLKDQFVRKIESFFCFFFMTSLSLPS